MLDCDGVILNSNGLKTQIFREIAEKYLTDPEEFIKYHKSNGGISRYEKFEHFVNIHYKKADINAEDLIFEYSSKLVPRYVKCEINADLANLVHYRFDEIYVVSGSDQDELRQVMEILGISRLFKEIYGSPLTKKTHINNIMATGTIGDSYIYVGDSYQDYVACRGYENLDFLLYEKWSECTRLSEIRGEVNSIIRLDALKKC